MVAMKLMAMTKQAMTLMAIMKQAMKMWAGKRARTMAMAMRVMEEKNAMEKMRAIRTTTRTRSSPMKSTAERSLGPDWPVEQGLVFRALSSFPRPQFYGLADNSWSSLYDLEWWQHRES